MSAVKNASGCIMDRWVVVAILAMSLALWGCHHDSAGTPVASSSGTTGQGIGDGETARAGGDGNSIFLDIVPPGSNGNSAGGVGLQGNVSKYPPNFDDQFAMYADLAYAKSPLQTTPCQPPENASQFVPASNQACNYFKHMGLTPDTVASKETLTLANGDKVTITRDDWGVPFINAPTRADAMYGVGYANAEDRLWLDDVLRYIGRGMLTQLLGAAPALEGFDANLAVTAGYSDQELTNMVNATMAQAGTLGPVVLSDITQFTAGINAYIDSLYGKNITKLPPEYVVLKTGGFPPPKFTVNDVVASAILIQALFASGGGNEISNVQLLQKLDPEFGPGSTSVPSGPCKLWRDLRAADDPQAPVTIDTHFATQSPPTLDESCPHDIKPGAAIWDPGSLQTRTTLSVDQLDVPSVLQNVPGLLESLLPGLQALFSGASGPATASAGRRDMPAPLVTQPPAHDRSHAPLLADSAHPVKPHTQRIMRASLNPLAGARAALAAAGIHIPARASNWIAVNADQTVDGHPIAVMGPQTGYYVPQLLWEFAVHSDTGTPDNPQLAVNGRGIATAMLPYIEIGRGTDYAWSATSGEDDITDTRVSYMCNTDGRPASAAIGSNGFPQADGYLYDAHDGKGMQCRKFYERKDTWTSATDVAGLAEGADLLPKTVSRYIMRTHYGPVVATATVNGRPVAISKQRSTFYNELSTVAPFAVADTSLVRGPKAFQRIFAGGVTGTFNWLYVDAKHVAYIHSGLFPIRNPGQDPDLPVWGNGDYEWAGDAAFVNGPNATYFDGRGGLDPATNPTGPDPGAKRAYPSRLAVVPDGNPLQTGTYTFKNYLKASAHPHTIDPQRGYIDSWNNKQAPGWWAADGFGSWGPTTRVAALADRLKAFQASGKKFNFANMVEIMADAAYSDVRAEQVLPLLLQLMQTGTLTTAQQHVVTLMQNWLDDGSNWIPGAHDLGAFRRDTHPDKAGVYDHRAAVVLMDAWYPQLVKTLLPQLTAIDPNCNPATDGGSNGLTLMGCNDMPTADGEGFFDGWYEQMKRVLAMVLDTPGHTDYRALKCAGSGTEKACRAGVLSALSKALDTLGGLSNKANWDGTQLQSEQFGTATGHTVEDYDSIRMTGLSLLGVPAMPWENRPTYQQVIEIRN